MGKVQSQSVGFDGILNNKNYYQKPFDVKKKQVEESKDRVIDLEKTNQQLVKDETRAFFEEVNRVLNDPREANRALDQRFILNELTSYRFYEAARTSNLIFSPFETVNTRAQIREDSLGC